MQSKQNKNTKMQIFKKWWFWLIVVVVIAAVACIKPVMNALSDREDSQPLDTTPLTNIITCKLGEPFEANGMHITYVSAEKWLPAGETAHPKEDYMFIRIKIEAENKSTETREIYDNEFTCFAYGGPQVTEYFSDERLQGGYLAPGEKTEGYVYFTVPVDAPIEIYYQSFIYWRNNAAVLSVEIAE